MENQDKYINLLGENESSLMRDRDLILRACQSCTLDPSAGATGDTVSEGHLGPIECVDEDLASTTYYAYLVKITCSGVLGLVPPLKTYPLTTSNKEFDFNFIPDYINSTQSGEYLYYLLSGSTTDTMTASTVSLGGSLIASGHSSVSTPENVTGLVITGVTEASVRRSMAQVKTATDNSSYNNNVMVVSNVYSVFVGGTTNTGTSKAYFTVYFQAPIDEELMTGSRGVAGLYYSGSTTSCRVTVTRYGSVSDGGTCYANQRLSLAPAEDTTCYERPTKETVMAEWNINEFVDVSDYNDLVQISNLAGIDDNDQVFDKSLNVTLHGTYSSYECFPFHAIRFFNNTPEYLDNAHSSFPLIA